MSGCALEAHTLSTGQRLPTPVLPTTSSRGGESAGMEDQRRAELERQLREVHAMSYGWALSVCGYRRESALDTLQESYLRVLDGRAAYGGRSSFRTWLFGVIRRVALEQRRQLKLRELLSLKWLAISAHETAVEGHQVERAVRLRRALLGLSPRQREVLDLVFYQDLTIAEAAQVLGIGLGSARIHYERGKTKLRKLLSGQDQ